MGTWSTGILDNDDAVGWFRRLGGGDDLHRIEAALDRVLDVGDDYLEAPEAQQAVAAAEAVARLHGRPDPDAPSSDWPGTRVHAARHLLEKARQVVDRILTPPSELQELWAESPDFAIWKRSLDQLIRRLDDARSGS